MTEDTSVGMFAWKRFHGDLGSLFWGGGQAFSVWKKKPFMVTNKGPQRATLILSKDNAPVTWLLCIKPLSHSPSGRLYILFNPIILGMYDRVKKLTM